MKAGHREVIWKAEVRSQILRGQLECDAYVQLQNVSKPIISV